MGKIAFVLAGQGAQHPGMGESLYSAFPAVRAILDKAESRRPGTLSQMFSGTAEELKQTENTQPCLYLADLAAAVALRESGIVPDAVAGFSLGEIPALAFAGAYSPADGFSIATARGSAMRRSAEKEPATMAAVLKLSAAQVEEICASLDGAYPVNYNCPGQIAVSVRLATLAPLTEAVKAAGGRALPLSVSGGFHSPFMESAAAEFAAVLTEFAVAAPQIPAYANVTAQPYTGDVKAMLARQIVSPVRWEDTVRALSAAGFDTFIECGPGTTLSKLITKTIPDARVYAVETAEHAAAVREEILA